MMVKDARRLAKGGVNFRILVPGKAPMFLAVKVSFGVAREEI